MAEGTWPKRGEESASNTRSGGIAQDTDRTVQNNASTKYASKLAAARLQAVLGNFCKPSPAIARASTSMAISVSTE